MDESTTLPPAANDGAGAVPDERGERRTGPGPAWRDEGPDGLFNHYRRRRLLALGALPAESAA
jgi:hypothetical protein